MPQFSCGMGDPIDMLAEECCEVIQAIMKYRRFNQAATDHNPDSGLTAREHLVREIGDLVVVLEILQAEATTLNLTSQELEGARVEKIERLKSQFGYELPTPKAV